MGHSLSLFSLKDVFIDLWKSSLGNFYFDAVLFSHSICICVNIILYTSWIICFCLHFYLAKSTIISIITLCYGFLTNIFMPGLQRKEGTCTRTILAQVPSRRWWGEQISTRCCYMGCSRSGSMARNTSVIRICWKLHSSWHSWARTANTWTSWSQGTWCH